MKQYIDKSAVVAEIKRIVDVENESIKSFEHHRNTREKQQYSTRMDLLERILSFINTLEVKEVDLEKEIELVKEDYEQVDVAWNNDFDFIAKHFFELGLKAKGE